MEDYATVMVVDDNPTNLNLLYSILTESGFKVRAAINGKLALSSINQVPPDIILLDIQMPDMDGYEVCQKIKASEQTKDIPILFISALSELGNKMEGFKAGAVDYITKPFQVEEVLMRVNTHLTIRNQQKSLEKQNQELREATLFREEVEGIMRHDLKGPLNPIVFYPDFIQKWDNLSEKSLKALKTIQDAGFMMLTMINRSLDLFKIEKGLYKLVAVQVDIVEIIRKIFNEKHLSIDMKRLNVIIKQNGEEISDSSKFYLMGEEFLCYITLDNLILNAIEASSEGDSITITLESNEKKVIKIHNPAEVPEEVKSRFFEKYVTSGKAAGTGLGTYSAKLAVEAQNGNISFESSQSNGTTITIEFSATE